MIKSTSKQKQVFLDNLPRNKSKNINWKKSVGKSVAFEYNEIRGTINIVDYIECRNPKIKIKFNEKDFLIGIGGFKKCKIGRLLGTYNGDFRLSVNDILNNKKSDLIILDRKYIKSGKINYKYYQYKCLKCEHIDWMEESKIMTGINCSCCTKKIAVLGVNTIWDTDKWMIDLGISEKDAKKYTKCSNKKITVKCPNCGEKKEVKISKINTYKSISCICGDGFTYPEKFMSEMLKQLNVRFETQYSPEYIKPKRSDFYLPKYKIIIETDGGLGHKGGIAHSKSDKTLNELIEIDEWKDKRHLKYGIKTIRINCFESDIEYIRDSILNSELSNMFDLSKINWIQCEEFALKNKIKEVCDYWNNKEEWETTANLSKVFGFHISTIIDYLHIGKRLNWCDYDSKVEKSKVSSRNGKNNSRRVEVFKNGVSLGCFESTSDLARQSKEMLGIKISQSSISGVCLGVRENCKGFVFKYIKL